MPTEAIAQDLFGFTPGRLAELRARLRLSQSEIASRLGYPKSTYVGWENGSHPPPAALYDGVAHHFGMAALQCLMGLALADSVSALEDFGPEDIHRWANLVGEAYRCSGLSHDDGDVADLTISLLRTPEHLRADRLRWAQDVLRRVRDSQVRRR